MRAATKAPARRHRRLFYHNGQDRAKATAAAAAAARHCRDGTPSRLLHQIAATETTAISRVAARGVQDKGISPSPAATHTSSVYLLLAHGRASSFVTTADSGPCFTVASKVQCQQCQTPSVQDRRCGCGRGDAVTVLCI